MTERALGMRWDSRPDPDALIPNHVPPPPPEGNVIALWPERWPLIALQECVDEVNAAPPAEKQQVRQNLPCGSCPEKTACLNAKRKELGPLLYGREIQTEPQSAESSMFPRSIWDPMLVGMPCAHHWRPPFSLEHQYAVVQAWDIAWSERAGGDYLVCETAVVNLKTGMRRLLNVERWQQISFDDQIDLIEQKWKQYGAMMVVIESDSAQQVWGQRLKKTTAVPVVMHDASEKRDFRIGVPGILIQLSNRKWEIPWMPGSYNHGEIDNLLDEFSAFGWNEGKLEGVGEHDDTVMCFWHLSWGIDRLLKQSGGGQEHHSGHVGGARL